MDPVVVVWVCYLNWDSGETSSTATLHTATIANTQYKKNSKNNKETKWNQDAVPGKMRKGRPTQVGALCRRHKWTPSAKCFCLCTVSVPPLTTAVGSADASPGTHLKHSDIQTGRLLFPLLVADERCRDRHCCPVAPHPPRWLSDQQTHRPARTSHTVTSPPGKFLFLYCWLTRDAETCTVTRPFAWSGAEEVFDSQTMSCSCRTIAFKHLPFHVSTLPESVVGHDRAWAASSERRVKTVTPTTHTHPSFPMTLFHTRTHTHNFFFLFLY